jgi:hypothetical protein
MEHQLAQSPSGQSIGRKANKSSGEGVILRVASGQWMIPEKLLRFVF